MKAVALKKLKIALLGGSGRMGQEILALGGVEGDLELILFTPSLSKKEVDVAIDFSSPQGFLKIAPWCEKNKIPLVLGTTGFTDKEQKGVKALSKKIPLFWSSNMSVGLNALCEALIQFSHNFEATKVTLEEVHHINKKDKPSGTAKFLYNEIRQAVPKGTEVESPKSIREGEVFGIHKVTFYGDGEFVSFQHEAKNRKIFAAGALRAARWLKKRKAGLYTMKDLLHE